MSGDAGPPQREEERLRSDKPQPQPAGRIDEYTAQIKEPANTDAEESVREAEQRFRTIFDNTSDGIFLLDLEARRFTMCNKSCLQMLGYTQEEYVNLGIADLHLPADLPFIYAQIEEFMKGRKGVRHDIRFKRKDGSVLFADLSPDLVLLNGKRYVVVSLKDVTERKQMEEALAESERKYHSLVENIPDVTWTTDRQGRTLFISPNVIDVYGYSAEEVYAGSGAWLENVHPDDRPYVEKAFRELFTKKKRYDVEYRIRRKDGNWIWLHDRSVSTYEKDGQWYADGIFSDVTEHKRMEDELRQYAEHLEELVAARTGELQESEAGLAAAQRLAHLGSWQWNIDADTASWSEETFRILGIARGPLQQHREDFLSRIVPEDRQRVDQALADALSGTRDYALDYRIALPDGRERVIHAQAQVLRSSDGRPVMMHGTVQDITERKRAEEALRESEQRYRRLVEDLKGSHFIYRHDPNGMLTYVSESVTQVLGYTPDEGMPHYGKYFTDHPANQAAHRHTELTLQGIHQPPYEVNVWHKDGSTRWLEVQEVPVLDAGGKVVAVEGVAQDITERKRAEETLRELNATLEAKVAQRTEDLRHTVDRLRELTLELSQAEDRERKRIAGILHEDVQQTLAAARFHLNLLASGTHSIEESQGIIELVRQMLRDAITRSRSLSHELSPAIYQVELIEILNWLARYMRQKHGLTVHVEAHGRVDSSSEPLKAFLYKVTQELLFNVVKHAGVHEARVRVRRLGQCIYLSVVDRGRGFDVQKLEGAVGFGLLSIRERVQLLGGRMKIRSRPGMGSRLAIAVPDQPISGAAVP